MPAPFARTLEQRHAFIQWFDGGLFSADVRLLKPQAEIYQLLAQRYQLQPGTTLFIDDHRPNVQAAAALGWQTLHLIEPAELSKCLALL
jgi:putative hydrolase of the HAD superfamily